MIGSNTGNRRKRQAAAWTKEELKRREQEMELLHPGYLNQRLNLYIFMGVVLMLRFVYSGLALILGMQTSMIFPLLTLAISYGYYSYCIRGARGLALFFFIVRCAELIHTIMQYGPYLFYMNFWGCIYCVVLILALLADCGFLACLYFSRKARIHMEYSKVLYSSARILPPETIYHVITEEESDEEF